jgi:hypothetical protein
MDVSDIQKQLEMGVPIEHEHTRNKTLATDIALQHLDEFPDYYTRLKKMEADAKKEHKKFKDVKEDAVTDLQRGITELPDASYDSIDNLMKRISRMKSVSTKKLHDDFVDKHNQTPDTWAKKNMKEEKKTLRNSNPCWKGYTDIGTKKKNGKTVPNCVPVNSESTDSLGYDWNTPIRERADRYCPKCEKLERRSECKYGTKYWDMFSLPAEIINSKKDYNITMPHPGNMPEEKDHEYSMARSELNTIANATKRLKKKMKGEGNIEAWVQSKITKAADYIDTAADYIDSGESKVNEDTTIEDANGNTFIQIIDIIKADRLVKEGKKMKGEDPCWKGYEMIGKKKKGGKEVPNCVPKEQKSFDSFMTEASAAWQRKEGKNPEGGLNKKGIASYRKENPGSNLSLAVTTKPSKLKKGSKSANRRKSFCSRMSGMKNKLTSAKTANDPNSRINKSLRKWNC